MTYESAVEYIHSHHWAGQTRGLGRVRELLRLLGDPQKKLKFVHVAGTNGKGSTSVMIASVLRAAGYKVGLNTSPYIMRFNERVRIDGIPISDKKLTAWVERMAPIIDGMADQPREFDIITALALAFFAEEGCDIAVLEVDERSSLLVYPYVKPDYLICNNIMRDSLKRNAHTEFISYIINSALPASTKLILNADDIIAATLGPNNNQKTYFGLDAEKPEANTPQHIRDIVYCPSCGALLESEYVRYNHIGRHYCPNCDFQSPTPDYLITNIDRTNNTFTIRHDSDSETYTLINDNIVNVYNFGAVIALLHEIGLSYEQISKGFSQSKIVKTRFETIQSGNTNITMLMAKGQNPIACARCYDYVARSQVENKGLVIIVDDLDDNINNSESTCWLYDCDYTALKDPSIKQIIFGGPRCKDHVLRAQLAGVDAEKISICENATKAAGMIDLTKCQNVFVLHELYRAADAKAAKEMLISMGRGEL